ncbi:hypothetical protein Tco_0915873 [Tanacetum coccineum]
MIAIFQDMLETSMEVFMDDFLVFGDSFDSCLVNLKQMLIRCKQAHLVLNWEKCHIMVTVHKVSHVGLGVDKANRQFSKISRPMTKLLEKDAVFDFYKECFKAFEFLKEKLTNAPIMVSPDWSCLFELIFIVNGHRVKLYHDEEQINELTTEEIHLMCEQGKMKAILFMAPFPENYRETMPWVTENPFIYSVVENTCNEAKLYDLDETGEGIVKGNFLYVKKDPSKTSTLGEK